MCFMDMVIWFKQYLFVELHNTWNKIVANTSRIRKFVKQTNKQETTTNKQKLILTPFRYRISKVNRRLQITI